MPFGLTVFNQSKLLADHNIDRSSARSSISNSTVIFSKTQNKGRGKSVDLRFVFIITIITLLLEMVLMFHKHHFFNILVYLSIFAIFFLNYFDHYYIKYVLFTLLISSLFDIVWLIINAKVIYLYINLLVILVSIHRNSSFNSSKWIFKNHCSLYFFFNFYQSKNLI